MRKKIRGRTPDNPDILGPSRVDVMERWIKKTPPRPVVGEPDAFTSSSIKAFAKGDINRQELMYRLRYGHESGRNDNP